MKNLLGIIITTLSLMAITPQCLSETLDADSALWNEVKSTNLIEDYQAYITQYPNGKFVALAENRIKKLQTESTNITQGKESGALQVAKPVTQPQSLNFLEGNWQCFTPATGKTINAHYSVRGNQVTAMMTQVDGSVIEFAYTGMISGDTIELSGESPSNPRLTNIIKKTKVLNNRETHGFFTSFQGMEVPFNSDCKKTD